VILHEQSDVVGVSQLRGHVAYDLIHWYANEFTPRLGRIVETPVRPMRGDHVRGVLGEQAVEARGHGGFGHVLCHTMLECDLGRVELAPRSLVYERRGDGGDGDEKRDANDGGRQPRPHQQWSIQSRREGAAIRSRVEMHGGHGRVVHPGHGQAHDDGTGQPEKSTADSSRITEPKRQPRRSRRDSHGDDDRHDNIGEVEARCEQREPGHVPASVGRMGP